MQYLIYLANVFRGELGISIYYKAPVSSILIERLVNSLILLIPSTIVAIALGIVVGALSAWKRRSAVSKSVMYLSLVLYSLPTYWLGGVLILLSISFLGLPVSGMYSYGAYYSSDFEKFMDILQHMILPFTTLTLVSFGGFALITWSSMVDLLREDFVTTLYVIGYPERDIHLKYVLRNALIPIVSVSAIAM
jgi:peptide/nickel transport system permease protein